VSLYTPEYPSRLLLADIKRIIDYADWGCEDLEEIFPPSLKLNEKTQPLAIIADSIKEELEKAKVAANKANQLAQQLYNHTNLLEEDNHERS